MDPTPPHLSYLLVSAPLAQLERAEESLAELVAQVKAARAECKQAKTQLSLAVRMVAQMDQAR